MLPKRQLSGLDDVSLNIREYSVRRGRRGEEEGARDGLLI